MHSFDDFDDDVKEALMREDNQAWTAIVVILMSIIAAGIGIALLALILVTSFR